MLRKISLILLLFLCSEIFSQTVAVRVIDGSGNPVTGLTDANIKFRRSPYGTGNVISGVTVTEVGVQGNYWCGSFPAYELAGLWINGTEQTWFGRQYVGDPKSYFGSLSGTNSWTGLNTFGNNTVYNDDIEANNLVTIYDPRIKTSSPFYTAPEADNLVTKQWVQNNFPVSFPINTNTIIVDSRATDVTGKIYNTIREAMDYASGTGNPSSTNWWHIYVLPSHLAYYQEDWTWYDYIELIGIGWVKVINNTNFSIFVRSTALSDRLTKAINIQFEQTDMNINFKKMILLDCSVKCIEDNTAPNLTFEVAQFENCAFVFTGTGIFTSTPINRVVNCVSNTNFTFGGTDEVTGFTVNTGFNYQQ